MLKCAVVAAAYPCERCACTCQHHNRAICIRLTPSLARPCLCTAILCCRRFSDLRCCIKNLILGLWGGGGGHGSGYMFKGGYHMARGATCTRGPQVTADATGGVHVGQQSAADVESSTIARRRPHRGYSDGARSYSSSSTVVEKRHVVKPETNASRSTAKQCCLFGCFAATVDIATTWATCHMLLAQRL